MNKNLISDIKKSFNRIIKENSVLDPEAENDSTQFHLSLKRFLEPETPIMRSVNLEQKGLPTLNITKSKEVFKVLESEIGALDGGVDDNLRYIRIKQYDVDYNKRSKQVADQIIENGWIEPLIVSYTRLGDPYIVEGQHRAAALSELGYYKAPCIVIFDKNYMADLIMNFKEDIGSKKDEFVGTFKSKDIFSESVNKKNDMNKNLINEIKNSILKAVKNKVLKEDDGYMEGHVAPNKNTGTSIDDLTDVYGEDIYSQKAARYFGEGYPYDQLAVNIVQSVRNKPDAKLKIYRAIPSVLTKIEKIADAEKQKDYVLKTNKLPKDVDNWETAEEYLGFLDREIERLKNLPDEDESGKMQINPGDWVGICKSYCVDHGKTQLNNKFRILSKVVLAKQVFSEGNSIHEYGYDPS